MKFIIVTNNPRVKETFEGKYEMIYKECSFDDLLFLVRDKLHMGYRLLTHPLSGSVKPNETPYKSILISDKPGPMDQDGILIMEDAITVATSGKFDRYRERQKILPQRILDDFQMIDFFLIKGGIESAMTGLI